MKIVTRAALFLLALILNCCNAVLLRTLVDETEAPITPDYKYLSSAPYVSFQIVSPPGGAEPNVVVEAFYFNYKGKEILRVRKTVSTGVIFYFNKGFQMATPTITVEFEAYLIERIIPTEEQAAVARVLAVPGSIFELTKNREFIHFIL